MKKYSTVRVIIREFDSWRGMSVSDRREFDTEEEAKEFVRIRNSQHCPPLKKGEKVPDCYYRAEIAD